jgi:predicted phosphodiesterase
MQISDSHISCDNESDQEYQQYSARMGNAYKVTRNAITGKETNPMQCFQELMTLAKKEKPDLIVLSGDIINYPSATAVSFVLDEVKATGLPFVYTAGNHDWHYEGMPGSSDSLRKTWIENRLKPLYSGRNPLFFNEIVGEINVVVIDNSTYQINEEQLNFFISQKKKKQAMALFVHIPIYMPSMSIASCGHPQWGKEADKGFQVERREPWPAEGNSKQTLQFLKEVFDSKNLIGIFAGHWHNNHSINYKGITQNLVFPAFSGHHRMINITPEA